MALGVAVVLVPLAFVISLPSTFHCRTFINGSAEANLVYPGGQRLSYESHEGTRQLIEMSSPQGPGFSAHFAVRLTDQGAFRWFDEQLQALGWQPLDPESRLQVVQSTGETTRGNGEAILLMRFGAGQGPPGSARPPDGHELLVYRYFIYDNTGIPECR
jgi:hypothetical protein